MTEGLKPGDLVEFARARTAIADEPAYDGNEEERSRAVLRLADELRVFLIKKGVDAETIGQKIKALIETNYNADGSVR